MINSFRTGTMDKSLDEVFEDEIEQSIKNQVENVNKIEDNKPNQ